MTDRAYALFLIPLFIALFGVKLFEAFSHGGVEVLPFENWSELRHHPRMYDDEGAIAARGYLFATSILALAVTCLGAVTASVFIVWQQKGKVLPLKFFAAAAGVGLAVFGIIFAQGNSTSVIQALGYDVFRLTVLDHWKDMQYPFSLATWVDIANALGIAGAVFVALCVCRLAPGPLTQPVASSPVDPRDLESAARGLEDRTRWLKYLLFSASTILIAAVTNMQAWRQWPTAVLNAVSKTTSDAYLELAKASIYYHSFLFVVILLAIFLPMAMWLQSRARDLSVMATDGKVMTPAVWRQDHGLTLSLSENVQRLLAVLSPILVGPIFEVLKHVPSG